MPQSPITFNANITPAGMQITNLLQLGTSLYVSPNGSDVRYSGRTRATPYATIGKAYAAATSGRGDVIVVDTTDDGYNENIVVAKDFLTIVGAQPSGYGRADWTPAAGVALTVRAQGFVARNLRFATAGNADNVIQNGNGFEYGNCVFDEGGQDAAHAGLRLVGAVSDSLSASEGKVWGSYFRGNGANMGLAIQHALAAAGGEGCSDNEIVGNRFVGNGVDLKSLVNTNGGGAGIFLRHLIANNDFLSVGAGFVYADMDQGAAGDLAANSALVTNNRFADLVLIAAQFAVGGQPKVIFAGNYDATGLVDGSAFNA